MTEKIIAEVILRSADGSSILDATEGITAQTIARYRVGEEVVSQASRKLEMLGFEIVQSGPLGLTISGPKDLFEKVFQTTLEVHTKQVMTPEMGGGKRPYYKETKPFQVPTDLSSLIAGVTLPVPAEYLP
jgi:subtilase family serine protease